MLDGVLNNKSDSNNDVLLFVTDRLDAAFRKSPVLADSPDLAKKYQYYKLDLAKELARHPYSMKLLQTLDGSEEACLILQSDIVLRVTAGDAQRDSSGFPSFHHSERIGEANLRVQDGIITDLNILAMSAIDGKLHDVVEDFAPENGEFLIRKIFGDETGDIIMRMTMPRREVLAECFPGIVSQYLSPQEMRGSPQQYLLRLKNDEKRTGHYLSLKAELKRAFKDHRRILARANFRYNVTKGNDNTDAIRSDCIDNDDGSLQFFANDYLGAEPRVKMEQGTKVVWVSTAKATLNRANRASFHQGIMSNFEFQAQHTGNEQNASAISGVAARIDAEFQAARADFDARINQVRQEALRSERDRDSLCM